MLVLTRKPGESIIIDGRITVRIVRVDSDTVKIGIAAPIDVPVHREEVYREIQLNNQAAVTDGRAPVPRLTPGAASHCPTARQRPVTVSPVELTKKP